MPVDLYASSWFVTLFATELQFDILPSILDLFFEIGQEALIKIGLALLHELKGCLKRSSQDEVLQLMSSPQTREQVYRGLDNSELLKLAMQFDTNT